MLILNADEVRAALPMDQTIRAMKRAYAAVSASAAQMPLRSRIGVAQHQGVSLFMPAYLPPEQEALVVKAVSVYAANPARGLPVIHAAVLVLEPETGRPAALLEGAALTAIRTGAGSGAATDLLARPDARVAAILGAGAQARTQLEAVCTVRPIDEVRVYAPTQAHVEALIDEMAGRGPIPVKIRPAGSPGEAVRGAQIVCAATSSRTPVFDDRDLAPGTHINGIGSFTPEMQEIPVETVRRARVVVDSRAAALEEAGELIQPIQAGQISKDHVHAELGEIILGLRPGRGSEDQITFFKSVGVAAQDAAAAALALRNASQLNLGQRVRF